MRLLINHPMVTEFLERHGPNCPRCGQTGWSQIARWREELELLRTELGVARKIIETARAWNIMPMDVKKALEEYDLLTHATYSAGPEIREG